MIPYLSTDDPGAGPVQVPPPPYFRPLRGEPRDVWMREGRWGVSSEPPTAAQANGIRYEEKAQDYLVEVLGPRYLRNPGLFFQDDSGPRVCIPDGLFLSGTTAVVFEIKIEHMPEAWWQLRRLYAPVLLRLKGVEQVHAVEMCRTFDPSMPFPEPIFIVEDVKSMMQNLQPDFGVIVWKP